MQDTSKKATAKKVTSIKSNLLSHEERSAIARKAAFAAHKTMSTTAWKRAHGKLRRKAA